MKTLQFSVALRHAHPGRLESECAALAAAGINAFHVDLSDGRFAPGLGMGLGAIEVARATGVPVHAHCQIEEPGRHVAALAAAGCAVIYIQVESSRHIHRALGQIREAGVAAGIAINPSTPLTKLTYLFDSADRILLLGVEPGAAPRAFVPSVFERVRIVSENVAYLKKNIVIEGEGWMNVENAARFARFGADSVVLDAAGFFNAEARDYTEDLSAWRERVAIEQQLV